MADRCGSAVLFIPNVLSTADKILASVRSAASQVAGGLVGHWFKGGLFSMRRCLGVAEYLIDFLNRVGGDYGWFSSS